MCEKDAVKMLFIFFSAGFEQPTPLRHDLSGLSETGKTRSLKGLASRRRGSGRFESGGQPCCQPLLNGTMPAAPIFRQIDRSEACVCRNVSKEQLRARSLASLGCPKGIRFAPPLHTRRALVALRRSRPLTHWLTIIILC